MSNLFLVLQLFISNEPGRTFHFPKYSYSSNTVQNNYLLLLAPSFPHEFTWEKAHGSFLSEELSFKDLLVWVHISYFGIGQSAFYLRVEMGGSYLLYLIAWLFESTH